MEWARIVERTVTRFSLREEPRGKGRNWKEFERIRNLKTFVENSQDGRSHQLFNNWFEVWLRETVYSFDAAVFLFNPLDTFSQSIRGNGHSGPLRGSRASELFTSGQILRFPWQDSTYKSYAPFDKLPIQSTNESIDQTDSWGYSIEPVSARSVSFVVFFSRLPGNVYSTVQCFNQSKLRPASVTCNFRI